MRKAYRWLPAVIWMAVIYYFSSKTGNDLGGWLDGIRKWLPFMEGFDWGHFVSYFILSLTFLYALEHNQRPFLSKALAVLLCFLYGLTDEFHQSFVPGRTPDWMDIRNDVIGAALAMLFVSIPPVNRLFRRL
ncbi:VanZ family protein [Paenibacillus silviterrae]|uniref:VanZ family protein n=1 Tax=Paenibacillus silviterrae TaxID=3242194 RepID=UPI0025431402|nr:VanZ family protein [Paenibacillus chinjuensis]